MMWIDDDITESMKLLICREDLIMMFVFSVGQFLPEKKRFLL